ncbi:MAG: O-antigen ligase family protein [Acidobacteriota bacterium]
MSSEATPRPALHLASLREEPSPAFTDAAFTDAAFHEAAFAETGSGEAPKDSPSAPGGEGRVDDASSGRRRSRRRRSHRRRSRRPRGTLARTVAVLLLGLLMVVAPWPFGGAVSSARSALWVALGLLLVGAVMTIPRGQKRLPPIAVPLLCLLALAAQATVQSVLGVAVDPAAAGNAALSFLAVAAALTLGAWLGGEHRSSRRWLLGAFVLGGSFQLLWGTRLWFAPNATLWGQEVGGASQRLRGTYVNPDHFAYFLEILLAVLFAWLWWSWRRSRRVPSLEQRLLLVVIPALAWVTAFIALSFTGSRAGLLAGLFGLAAQAWWVIRGSGRGQERSGVRWDRLRRGLAVVALAVVAVGLTLWLGAWEGFGRLLTTSSYELISNSRSQVYAVSLELWFPQPWWGLGFGGFRDAFPAVQPESLRGLWTHAHSDYLELLICGGVIGLGLALAGAFALWRRLLQVWAAGYRSEGRAAALAALGALAAVGAHEMVDFGLLLPANALLLGILCGAAAAVPRR